MSEKVHRRGDPCTQSLRTRRNWEKRGTGSSGQREQCVQRPIGENDILRVLK